MSTWAVGTVTLCAVQGCQSTPPEPVETYLSVWVMPTHVPGPDEWITTVRGFVSGVEFDAFSPLIGMGECMDHDGIDPPLSHEYTSDLQVTLGSAGEWTMFQMAEGWIEPSEPIPSGALLPEGASIALHVPELSEPLTLAAPGIPSIVAPADGAAIARVPLRIEWEPSDEDQIYVALSFFDGDGNFLLAHSCILDDSGAAVLEPWTNAPASAATAVLRARYGHSASRTQAGVRYGLYARATEILAFTIASTGQ